MARQRALMLVLALALLVVGASAASGAPASAADSTPVLSGTFAGTLTLSKDWGGSGYGGANGPTSFTFGAGCKVGAPCTATSKNGGALALQPSGSGFRYAVDTKEPCTDNVTGALRSNVAFDSHYGITFTPAATVARGGVTYVTKLRGTFESRFAVNAVGRSLNCTVRPNATEQESEAGTYALALAPLAKPKSLARTAPLAVPGTAPSQPSGTTPGKTPGTNPGAATLPRFALPQSQAQRDSAAAVDAGRRSSVPGALVTPTDAIASIRPRLGKDLLLVALLGLLIVFPAQLFNATYDENSERIDRQLAKLRLRRRRRSQAQGRERSRFRRVTVFVLCTVIGTLLAGFLDPKFGLNTASYALAAGVLASVVVGVLVAVVAGGLYRSASREPRRWHLDAIPSSLLFAVLCVAASRLTGFQPGYLYGALGGAAFLVAMEARKEGKAEATVTVVTLLVALGAWVGFEQVSAAANAEGASFLTLSSDTLLATLFIGGLEGLFFALVPLRVLPGGRIKEWSWFVWGLLFAAVAYVFVHVLLAPESGYMGRATEASTAVSLAFFVAFAAISILFWGYFKVRPTKDDPAPPAAPVGMPAMAGAGQGQAWPQQPPPGYWQQDPPPGQWQQGPPPGQWPQQAPPGYWQQQPAPPPPPPPATTHEDPQPPTEPDRSGS